MKINIITAKTKINIEENFKVEAGPGAGKTEFLINHIRNVINNSNRLRKTRKIACITYTNTAVENITNRLGEGASNHVDVSTIHSFLYRNVVKPYCSFLPDEFELDIGKFTNHKEPIIYNSHISNWIQSGEFGQKLTNPNNANQILKSPSRDLQFMALRNWISSVYADLVEERTIKFKGINKNARTVNIENDGIFQIKYENVDILEDNIIDYKRLNWQKGIVDHEDILYFSYILIEKYPFILTVLQAKYPYFFVDEYQDTNQIQADILTKLKENGCIVGVIGDKAQSIFSFAGAKMHLFKDFVVPQSNSYTIKENRRSSEAIVDFLNKTREDIEQIYCSKYNNVKRSCDLNDVVIIVGNRNKAYEKAKRICGDEKLVSLSRKNRVCSEMKAMYENLSISNILVNEFYINDSNSKRRNTIIDLMKIAELANNDQIQEAIKLIERYHSDISYDNRKNFKRKSLNNLMILMKNYNHFKNGSLFDFHDVLINQLKLDISNLSKRGRIKEFYDNTKYNELALTIFRTDDIGDHITIHKSKGHEFKNVFVVSDEELKKFLFDPDLTKEEHRIRYVAVSRAKERLFIHIEEMTKKEKEALKEQYKCYLLCL